MKAKLRLLIFGISVILLPSLLYLIKSTFVRFSPLWFFSVVKNKTNKYKFDVDNIFQSSSVIRTMNRDEFIQHNVHLRKLNQPFEWHSQGPGSNPDEVVENNQVSNNETEHDTKKKPSTCRNSVQGKLWIADDQGKTFLI